MERSQKIKPSGRETNTGQPDYEVFPDATPRQEGGDDSLAESSPADTRSDEKVIAQHAREKTNLPSNEEENISK